MALITPVQVARELCLTLSEVEELVHSGQLPAAIVLGQVRIDPVLLDQFVMKAHEERSMGVVALRRGRMTDIAPLGSSAADESTAESGDGPPGVDPGIPARPAAPSAAVDLGLSPHQFRVLIMVADGMSNQEIAQRLQVAHSTVKSHVSRILLALQLRDREQLIAFSWRHHLVP